jgi:peptidoglycan/LPS O-acetylase OafA/YrhL
LVPSATLGGPDESDFTSRLVRTIKSVMGIADPPSTAQPDGRAAPPRRAGFILAGVALLALWGASLMPAIANWNNPNEDGFSLVPAFAATLTALPLGLSATFAGVSGRDQAMRRARIHLVLAAALLLLVAMLELLRRLSVDL